jgi:hypothetical protein
MNGKVHIQDPYYLDNNKAHNRQTIMNTKEGWLNLNVSELWLHIIEDMEVESPESHGVNQNIIDILINKH